MDIVQDDDDDSLNSSHLLAMPLLIFFLSPSPFFPLPFLAISLFSSSSSEAAMTIAHVLPFVFGVLWFVFLFVVLVLSLMQELQCIGKLYGVPEQMNQSSIALQTDCSLFRFWFWSFGVGLGTLHLGFVCRSEAFSSFMS